MDLFDMALSLTRGVGGVTATKLVERYFSAENVFSMPYEKLVSDGVVNEKIAFAISSRASFKEAQEEIEYCEMHKIKAIARGDDEYPPQLRRLNDSPYILYLLGDSSLLTRNLIAMVGSRSTDEYGLLSCEKIVGDIAKEVHNPVIVSGLAFGADSYAHRAALSNNIPTVAVVPCPLPNVLPSAHRGLADAILAQGGAIISHLHSRSRGAGMAFIARNRVIAGMSHCTILIQSGYDGGAMGTMEMTKEMGRPAFAIPGRIFDHYSSGCNRLIALSDAISISSAEDIIRAMGWERRRLATREIEPYNKQEVESGLERYEEVVRDLSEQQISMLQSMLRDEPIHITDLEKMNPIPMHEFNVVLIELELLGLVKSIPGSLYQRTIPLAALK